MRALLANGAPPLSETKVGKIALTFAIASGHLNVVKTLVEMGGLEQIHKQDLAHCVQIADLECTDPRC